MWQKQTQTPTSVILSSYFRVAIKNTHCECSNHVRLKPLIRSRGLDSFRAVLISTYTNIHYLIVLTVLSDASSHRNSKFVHRVPSLYQLARPSWGLQTFNHNEQIMIFFSRPQKSLRWHKLRFRGKVMREHAPSLCRGLPDLKALWQSVSLRRRGRTWTGGETLMNTDQGIWQEEGFVVNFQKMKKTLYF